MEEETPTLYRRGASRKSDFFRDLAHMIGRTGLADDPANYRLLSEASGRLPASGSPG